MFWLYFSGSTVFQSFFQAFQRMATVFIGTHSNGSSFSFEHSLETQSKKFFF